MRDDSEKPAGDAADRPPDAQAIERRRLLLKSLGKGSALVAAASPLASYAAPNLITSATTHCSVSGFKSSVVSRMPTGAQTCRVPPPSSLVANGQGVGDIWLRVLELFSGATAATLRFNQLFPTSPNSNPVLTILNTLPNSEEALFIAAFFAGRAKDLSLANPPNGAHWPYGVTDVRGHYDAGVTQRPDILAFYRLVMGLPP